MRPSLVLGILVSVAACAAPRTQTSVPETSEILWDKWGVPHIYGATDADVFRGFGWAQLHSHGDVILEVYSEARGRSAEIWGESKLESDRMARKVGVVPTAQRWYDEIDDEFRHCLDAFATGMNDFASRHPDALSEKAREVLPVTATDVLAHCIWQMHFRFVARGATRVASRAAASGSNAWAIGPSRSASGHAMLVANPHLMWSGASLFYEAHLVGPGWNLQGTTLVGFPVLIIAFNESLGWSHTVSTHDGADVYEVDVVEGGYSFDGETRAFELREEAIRIREDDGTLREETFTSRATVHGPVIAESNGHAYAVRLVGLDAPGMLRQWWEMGRASNLEEFEAALRRLQVPTFNVVYADRDGHILYLFNGLVPRRPQLDAVSDWSGVVPGDTSETLWTEALAYDELPRIVDPQQGWVQNCNDPPWAATVPTELDPEDYIPGLAPQWMHWRAQRCVSMLTADDSVTFEELMAMKHSTRMELSDRLLDDLFEAARGETDEMIQQAVSVLEGWDRSANADSRGAILFEAWSREMRFGFTGGEQFEVLWDPARPASTPDGLADPAAAVEALERAAQSVIDRHERLDVAWGDVNRIDYGGHDLPGNGASGSPLGVVRVAAFMPEDESGKRRWLRGGETYYAMIEFSDPVRAEVLTSYGNSSQDGSPHKGDQIPLYAENKSRPALMTREDVEANLQRTVSLDR